MAEAPREAINSGYLGVSTQTLGNGLWRTRVRHEKAAKEQHDAWWSSQEKRKLSSNNTISNERYAAAVRVQDDYRELLKQKQLAAQRRKAS